MPLPIDVKTTATKKLEEYEGRLSHLYLDSVGQVTIGVGHLVSGRNAVTGLVLDKAVNDLPGPLATDPEKLGDYEAIAKQPKGYKAAWYK